MTSDRSEFIAVYGRRRIGKTFLVHEAFNYTFTFQYSGIYKKSRTDQLTAFKNALKEAGVKSPETPANWMEAFEMLKDLIRASHAKKKVIFLDELSWMHTHRCDLIPALESFWNGWASARKDVVLIVCASATSWMIKKIVHAKGGLYNRLTAQIWLQPFNLNECKMYVETLNLPFNNDQIIELYMILGGVPYYWSLMKKNLGLPQNIDRLFFDSTPKLPNEFDYLFSSLFESPDNYVKIIEVLATKKLGMNYSEIMKNIGKDAGGTLSDMLEDLCNCGFIRSYRPFGGIKRGTLFQLTDNFILFHFKYLTKKSSDPKFWEHNYTKPGLNSWRGLAFERICLLHTEQIKKALGISGLYTEVCSWKCEEDKEKGISGAQIDLLIDRDDKHVNVCEIKYSSDIFSIDKNYEEKLTTKLSSFRRATGTRKGVILTMITNHGLALNSHSGIVQASITANDLFASE